jgi:ribosome biogenesis protein SSF1/2
MTPPLVVLNNFTQATASHTKLMRVTFQHMFPTINIKTVRLSECRRVVLFHLAEDGNVEMRHYAVRANPVGVSKSVKRIIEAKIPDLGTLEVGGHSFSFCCRTS